jgi:3-methyl-2-oxobutanoate hydroxymethyltransferase
VLVVHDLLGINERVPKFARKFADLRGVITDAVESFMREVDAGTFPDEDHSSS